MGHYQLTNRFVYVWTLRLRVHIRQLSTHEYELTGTPALQPVSGDEEVPNSAALNGIYEQLGLMERSLWQRFLDRSLAGMEQPATQGWRRTRAVQAWER